MAKPAPQPDTPAPPAFDEKALRDWVLAEIAKAAAADPPGLAKLVKDTVDGQCEDIKVWVKREVALNAVGASEGERAVMNP